MKTIKEAAKECMYYINDRCEELQLGHLSESFEKGVEFTQRWIPVEEELPETNEFEESKICLIKNKYAIDIGRYYSNYKRWFFSTRNIFEVTHWRYIDIK